MQAVLICCLIELDYVDPSLFVGMYHNLRSRAVDMAQQVIYFIVWTARLLVPGLSGFWESARLQSHATKSSVKGTSHTSWSTVDTAQRTGLFVARERQKEVPYPLLSDKRWLSTSCQRVPTSSSQSRKHLESSQLSMSPPCSASIAIPLQDRKRKVLTTTICVYPTWKDSILTSSTLGKPCARIKTSSWWCGRVQEGCMELTCVLCVSPNNHSSQNHVVKNSAHRVVIIASGTALLFWGFK
jgi:hypothetical protein